MTSLQRMVATMVVGVTAALRGVTVCHNARMMKTKMTVVMGRICLVAFQTTRGSMPIRVIIVWLGVTLLWTVMMAVMRETVSTVLCNL